MTGKPERAVGYVDHMLQAADGIGMFIAGLSKADFLASAMAGAAVIRNLEINGEASRRVLERCPAVAAAHPTVPWREVYRMRNRVAHGYDTVSLEIVWTIASRDVPVLTTQLRDALDALQTQAP